jgi:hypothetical protein
MGNTSWYKSSGLVGLQSVALVAALITHDSKAFALGTPPAGVVAFSWVSGDPPQPMMAVTDGICGLTSVTSPFLGFNDAVRIENQNGFWTLVGTSSATTAFQKYNAVCAPFRVFKTPAGPILAFTNAITAQFPSGHNEVDLAGPESQCWLTGMSGTFVNGPSVPDQVSVQSVVDPGFVGWTLLAQPANPRDDVIWGSAACLSVPGRTNVRTAGFNGGPWSGMQGVDVRLPSARDALCVLTKVAGILSAPPQQPNSGIPPDLVKITNHPRSSPSFQLLQGAGSSQPSWITASVTCVYYDQTVP